MLLQLSKYGIMPHIIKSKWMEQKGMTFDHDFYVVVGKQCRTEKMRTQVTNTISLYKLTNALLLLICFKLLMKSMKLC